MSNQAIDTYTNIHIFKYLYILLHKYLYLSHGEQIKDLTYTICRAYIYHIEDHCRLKNTELVHRHKYTDIHIKHKYIYILLHIDIQILT